MREQSGAGAGTGTTTGAGTGAGTGTGTGVRQKDLIAAGEAEMAKLRGGNFDLISKLFT
jgi:hypothetical protein